jgi:hypothetical protein
MRKDPTTPKLKEFEIHRNRKIPKKGYTVKQYFGLIHLNDGAYLTGLGFNIFSGSNLLATG